MRVYSSRLVQRIEWSFDQYGQRRMVERISGGEASATVAVPGVYWWGSQEQLTGVLSLLGWMSLAACAIVPWWILLEFARIGYALCFPAHTAPPQFDGLGAALLTAAVCGAFFAGITHLQTLCLERGGTPAAAQPQQELGFPVRSVRPEITEAPDL